MFVECTEQAVGVCSSIVACALPKGHAGSHEGRDGLTWVKWDAGKIPLMDPYFCAAIKDDGRYVAKCFKAQGHDGAHDFSGVKMPF